jgi:small subunit ribosomal protein S8
MISDPISDMLARIRNALLAHHERTEIPYSNLKLRIAEILKEEGYVADCHADQTGHGKITVVLKYGRSRQAAIAGLRRKSRPGRRVYVGYDGIPEVHNGLGVSILSTSRGVMTDRAAREQQVGGEILCEVW